MYSFHRTVFTEVLPSKNGGDIHTDIQGKWAVNRGTITGGQIYWVFGLCPSSGIPETRKPL
jgi:hypothetical protein